MSLAGKIYCSVVAASTVVGGGVGVYEWFHEPAHKSTQKPYVQFLGQAVGLTFCVSVGAVCGLGIGIASPLILPCFALKYLIKKSD